MKKIALVLSCCAVVAGCSGSSGDAGAKGDPGAAGATGTPGTAGTAGTAGATGTAGTAGTAGAKGDPGIPFDGGAPVLASCKAIKTANAAAVDGVFKIRVDGIDIDAYCNMTDGGWTLIQSLNTTFAGLEAVPVKKGSGKYLPVFFTQRLAEGATQMRVQIRDTGDYVDSVANTFPILQLREALLLSDNANKATNDTYWTLSATAATITLANLDFTCNSTSVGFPAMFHACGNGGGLHIFSNTTTHGFANNSQDLDVWVK